MQPAQWSSRIGYILAAAGSAVGLGAIWKFPYVTAANGGGAFLLLFLLFSFTLGVAVLIGETLLGSHTQRGVQGALVSLLGKSWAWMGSLGLLCCFMIYSFYSVVGGWTVGYTGLALSGQLIDNDGAALTALFNNYVSHPLWPIATHLLFAGITFAFVQGGIAKGVERALSWMMPALFLMMLLLALVGLSMPGAWAGVEQLFVPDFSKVSGQSVLDALGLAFFSLSIGVGMHTTYGAYLPSSDGVPRSAGWVVLVASLIAVLAGLMIFPALAATGIDPSAGPGLTFMTMPAVFKLLPFGHVLAVVFFSLLMVAALSSSISMLEHLQCFAAERFGWTRRQAAALVTSLIALTGIPISLSFGAWSEVKLFGRNFFELFDFLTSNIMMPSFGLILAVLLGWRIGDHLIPHNASPLLRSFLLICWRYLAPALIGSILVRGVL
ncbi:MAG: sodium-dependent transporter [Aeromonas sp.]